MNYNFKLIVTLICVCFSSFSFLAQENLEASLYVSPETVIVGLDNVFDKENELNTSTQKTNFSNETVNTVVFVSKNTLFFSANDLQIEIQSKNNNIAYNKTVKKPVAVSKKTHQQKKIDKKKPSQNNFKQSPFSNSLPFSNNSFSTKVVSTTVVTNPLAKIKNKVLILANNKFIAFYNPSQIIQISYCFLKVNLPSYFLTSNHNTRPPPKNFIS